MLCSGERTATQNLKAEKNDAKAKQKKIMSLNIY